MAGCYRREGEREGRAEGGGGQLTPSSCSEQPRRRVMSESSALRENWHLVALASAAVWTGVQAVCPVVSRHVAGLHYSRLDEKQRLDWDVRIVGLTHGEQSLGATRMPWTDISLAVTSCHRLGWLPSYSLEAAKVAGSRSFAGVLRRITIFHCVVARLFYMGYCGLDHTRMGRRLHCPRCSLCLCISYLLLARALQPICWCGCSRLCSIVIAE